MSWRWLLLEPLNNLRLLGRRAVLALLGIAVGCGAVVALLTIGDNAQREAMRVFQGMGSDLLVASVQLPFSAPRAAPSMSRSLDTALLRAALPELAAVSALVPAGVEVRLNGNAVSATVVGSGAELPAVLDLSLAQGRFLNDFDVRSTYVVLGARVVSQWRQAGQSVGLGSRVQIGGYLFEVVGLLHPSGQNPLIPVSVDDAVLVPLAGMRRVVPNPQITSVLARSHAGDDLSSSAARLQAWLAQTLRGFEIDVQIPGHLLDGMARQSRLFSWLLAGLGGISLLVGGVGVMNVMIMNVSERRREIGVRMALGARPRDIAVLFLLEAVVLATVGAGMGAVVGMAAAWLFVSVSGWSDFVVSAVALPLGVGSAIVTGMFFGLSPALAASRLQPVEALRDV